MSAPADALRDLAGLLRALLEPGALPAVVHCEAGCDRTGVVAALILGLLGVPDGDIGAEPDLALLAGDYLYALGLERLAELGDLESVRELSDLISLSAQIHDGADGPAVADREAGALWLSSALAIAAGATVAHERAKARLRAEDAAAADELWAAASTAAAATGLEVALREAADSIDFAIGDLS